MYQVFHIIFQNQLENQLPTAFTAATAPFSTVSTISQYMSFSPSSRAVMPSLFFLYLNQCYLSCTLHLLLHHHVALLWLSYINRWQSVSDPAR